MLITAGDNADRVRSETAFGVDRRTPGGGEEGHGFAGTGDDDDVQAGRWL
jgi:hypothetical protein